MEAIWEWGITLVLTLQAGGGALVPLWRGLSLLGDEIFFLMLIPLLFWCVSPRLSLRVGIALMLGTAVNTACKLAFAGPRPFWYSGQVSALTAESSFGLPSAHAQNTVGVWGVIAASAGRWWAWAAMVVLALLVGLSRVVLGVHFPSDVLGGWVLGALTLGAFLAWGEPLWRRVAGLGLGAQLGLTFAASLVLVGVSALALGAHAARTIPEAWVQNAALSLPDDPIAPWSLDTALTTGGTWLGFTAGALLLWARGGFDASGPWWQRAARLALGLVVVLALWAGLGAIFPRGETIIAGLLRYARYTLLGLWIALGAPLLFQQLRLAPAPRPAIAVIQPS